MLLRRTLAAAATSLVVGVMLRLSLWQWSRGRSRGSFLNYSYAVEWVLLAGLVVIAVGWLWREGTRAGGNAAPPTPTPGSPVVGPPLAEGEELADLTYVRLLRRLGLRTG